ncbi:putative membrane protein [Microbacterium ginsengiterrae]|uniref:Putative membrane protein n=1 Tax=Microbacterium ginsengiterrae TaxID=546115 RepID=A0A7W9FBD9_9MICO|nr:glutamine amidotransferase [Microbacterium ginsengiterrae]MBB5743201.1 putative membrane protein [Microbacterium ginsengiterrae]
MAQVLLAGESWSTTTIHTKGFDTFTTSSYGEGAADFISALETRGHAVEFQPNHVAAERFPSDRAALADIDVVVLSDIGSNTLLLPDGVFSRGERFPNRLQLLVDWVRDGGALLMVGGYLSFQGIEGKANYRGTALADILPVEMEIGDDREETPQGEQPRVVAQHAITHGLDPHWPHILGHHRVRPRPGAEVLVEAGAHPLLLVDDEGAGRVAAFTSDMGPHWLPPEFLAWSGSATMWCNLVEWLAEGRRG